MSKLYCFILFCFYAVSNQVCADTVNIVSIDLKPFGIRLDDNKRRGIFYDFSNKVAQEAGLEYRNEIKPYARVIREIKLGKADFTIMLPIDPILEVANKLESVMTLENIVIGLPEANITNYQDLKGKSLGSIRSATYDLSVKRDKSIKRYYTNDYHQSIKMLLAKRFDAIIGVKRSVYYELAKIGLPKSALGEPLTLNQQETYLLVSKKSNLDSNQIQKINDAVIKLKKSNYLQNLIQEYDRTLLNK